MSRTRAVRLIAPLLIVPVLIAGCGTSSDRGLRSQDWATIGAYQQEVNDLSTQVATLLTAAPTNAPSTPTVPMGQGWAVTATIAESAGTYPNVSDEPDAPTAVAAAGIFLAVDLEVVNQQRAPVPQFPWWQLRLRDPDGRVFAPVRAATSGYLSRRKDIVRPEQYQPGLTYQQAVVFDVPPGAEGLTLVSADGTLSVPLEGAVPTPAS